PALGVLAGLSRPVVVDLMRRTGETGFLGTLCSDRASIVYVDKVESDHVIRYAGGVGDRRPLHATSSGKVILAFLSPDEREQVLQSLSLARHTERTVTSRPALRASLEAIRRAGVCVTTDELVSGASGIAAPVFDRYGRVAGACAIGGPTDRVGPRTRTLATEVAATARTLSARLGHRPRDGKEAGTRAAPGGTPTPRKPSGGVAPGVGAGHGGKPPQDGRRGRAHDGRVHPESGRLRRGDGGGGGARHRRRAARDRRTSQPAPGAPGGRAGGDGRRRCAPGGLRSSGPRSRTDAGAARPRAGFSSGVRPRRQRVQDGRRGPRSGPATPRRGARRGGAGRSRAG